MTGEPADADASHAARLSGLRGKPSIRKRDFPEASIALRRRPTVTSAGTILPSLKLGEMDWIGLEPGSRGWQRYDRVKEAHKDRPKLYPHG